MSTLRLSEIYIYPIKSLGGIRVSEANILEKGLRHDRRWMLVDEQGVFLTQRVHPVLALFKLEHNEAAHSFIIHFNNDSIELSYAASPAGQPFEVTIWDDRVIAHEVSAAHSAWFSKHINMPCKLVSFPEDNPRAVDPIYAVNHEHVSLADAYPFMIIGQASLDFLNAKLDEKLPMNRFRPNFVFTGGEPHEEDTWREFTIGSNHFVGVKTCSRCVLTTINQDTGEKGVEPLRTLATYRNINNKIKFGQNVVALSFGTVREGDPIALISRQNPI